MDPIRPSGPTPPRGPIEPTKEARPAAGATPFSGSMSAGAPDEIVRRALEQPSFAAQTREIAELRRQGLGQDEIRRAVIERHLTEYLGEKPDGEMLQSIESRVRENPSLSAIFARLFAGSNSPPSD